MSKAICPNCKSEIGRFYPKRVLWPKKAAWYKPKEHLIQCQSCNKYLLYKTPNSSIISVLCILVFLMKVNNALYADYLYLGFVVLISAMALYQFLAKEPYKLSQYQD